MTVLLASLLAGSCVAGSAAVHRGAPSDQDDPAIPKQVPGVKPCPGLKGPQVSTQRGRTAVDVQVKMDVDVDGAPNAYGPKGKKTLDILEHAMSPKNGPDPGKVVGFMTDYDGGPPTIQRKGDPYPGYYVSQTDFADKNNKRMEDPRRYVDATKINYVVEGKAAQQAGVEMGDFVTVYSCRTGKNVYGIVADSGNESGAEGSLALVQALGYKIYDGKDESVTDKEIVIRYYPKSNPNKEFFKSQAELDRAAEKLGLVKY
jgi:hypothetical protein